MRNDFKMIAGLTASALLILVSAVPVLSFAARPAENMVRIPAGPFIMGSDETDGIIGIDVGVDETPRHRVTLPSFDIDRYEVTNGEYQEFIRATGHRVPSEPRFPQYFEWKNGKVPNGQEDYPVSYIDFEDADAYCKWRGKRLPTEEEWEKGARNGRKKMALG